MVWPTESACRSHPNWVVGLSKVSPICSIAIYQLGGHWLQSSYYLHVCHLRHSEHRYRLHNPSVGEKICLEVLRDTKNNLPYEEERSSGWPTTGGTLESLIFLGLHILKHDQHASSSGRVCVQFEGNWGIMLCKHTDHSHWAHIP